ncbi:ATP-binding protein [Sandaracinus amylolyticus]|uniref:histidine kinase n=1 Tax=Sandaracinus amylolyticus TaxID=927083 RepID=A0A0F6YNI6_9BACT|nr:ATP-binding protein [Sandaracinus amylolyticus]AKF10488.1 Chemotaxis protein methyltransferase CheR [Sandaracinus amylolyticus]
MRTNARARRALRALAIASVATLVVALLHVWLRPWLGSTASLMLFLLAVYVSASVAGMLGGSIAAVLGVLVGSVFFMGRPGELGPLASGDQVRVVFFLAVAIAMSATSELLLRTRRRLQREVDARSDALAEREKLLLRERDARANAESMARLRDEFVGTVSHELRTPVNAILGFAVLLRQRASVDPKIVRGLEVIERNARAQARLIDDMLDLGRILGGKMALVPERLDLRVPIRDALESVRMSARAKHLVLEIDLGEEAVPVMGDAGRLQQVAWNLLSNALKFTPSGGRVRVALRREDERAVLDVIDTGEGIDPAFLPHVFDRFRQQDASSTRVHGGMGIGLAITRQLIELHGGRVRAESAGRGRGARFEVSLPIAEPGAQPHAEEAMPTRPSAVTPVPLAHGLLEGARVLLVEDDPDSREAVREGLRSSGAMVDAADAAEPALALLDRGRYDVLVSDIGMPGHDGWWLMREVRRAAAQYSRIPAIAISGFVREEDARASSEAGFDRHVGKPLDPIELAREIARMIGRPSDVTSAPS